VTKITYQLPSDNFVTLKVYDILGKEVAVLVNGNVKAGSHTVAFNASHLSSGVYYYRIQAGELSETRRMILLK
jgi:glucuronoarabinoxylan endo-1,4-beta-xylanase